MLPAAYLAFAVWLVFRFLLNSDPSQRAAVYVIRVTEPEGQEQEEAHMPGDGDGGAAGPGDVQPGVARASASSAGTAASDRSGEQSSRHALLSRTGSSGLGGGAGWTSRLRRASKRLRRFVSRTILGYHPEEMGGEWVGTTPGSTFADRYGAVFTCKGPPVRHVPGTYAWRDDGGGLDRGAMVHAAEPTRAARAQQDFAQ